MSDNKPRDMYTAAAPLKLAYQKRFEQDPRAFDIHIFKALITDAPITGETDFAGGMEEVEKAVDYQTFTPSKMIEISLGDAEFMFDDAGGEAVDAVQTVGILQEANVPERSVIHWKERINATEVRSILKYVLSIKSTDRGGLLVAQYMLIPFEGDPSDLPEINPAANYVAHYPFTVDLLDLINGYSLLNDVAPVISSVNGIELTGEVNARISMFSNKGVYIDDSSATVQAVLGAHTDGDFLDGVNLTTKELTFLNGGKYEAAVTNDFIGAIFYGFNGAIVRILSVTAPGETIGYEVINGTDQEITAAFNNSGQTPQAFVIDFSESGYFLDEVGLTTLRVAVGDTGLVPAVRINLVNDFQISFSASFQRISASGLVFENKYSNDLDVFRVKRVGDGLALERSRLGTTVLESTPATPDLPDSSVFSFTATQSADYGIMLEVREVSGSYSETVSLNNAEMKKDINPWQSSITLADGMTVKDFILEPL